MIAIYDYRAVTVVKKVLYVAWVVWVWFAAEPFWVEAHAVDVRAGGIHDLDYVVYLRCACGVTT